MLPENVTVICGIPAPHLPSALEKGAAKGEVSFPRSLKESTWLASQMGTALASASPLSPQEGATWSAGLHPNTGACACLAGVTHFPQLHSWNPAEPFPWAHRWPLCPHGLCSHLFFRSTFWGLPSFSRLLVLSGSRPRPTPEPQ